MTGGRGRRKNAVRITIGPTPAFGYIAAQPVTGRTAQPSRSERS